MFWVPQEVTRDAANPVDLVLDLPDALAPSECQPDFRDERVLGLMMREIVFEDVKHDPRSAAITDVALSMESLGGNCEFGLVQRRCAADPLGLLRFTTSPMRSLLPALAARFEGVGSPENIDFVVHGTEENSEWMSVDRSYGFVSHTRQRQHTVTRDRMLALESRRLPRLVEKLIADLEAAEKLFVYQGDTAKDVSSVAPLVDAIRRYHPANILLLVLEDGDRAGTAEQSGPHLITGYVERLHEAANEHTISWPSWRWMLPRAHAIFLHMRAATLPARH